MYREMSSTMFSITHLIRFTNRKKNHEVLISTVLLVKTTEFAYFLSNIIRPGLITWTG